VEEALAIGTSNFDDIEISLFAAKKIVFYIWFCLQFNRLPITNFIISILDVFLIYLHRALILQQFFVTF
jgi:hypothetical protein